MIKSIEINGVTYNVGMATAVDQKTLMLLLGGKIALNSAASAVEQIDTMLLKGALLTLDESTFDRIAKITLGKCAIHNTDEVITVNKFQGKMDDYFTLIAEAIYYNLNDFFLWLDKVNLANRPIKRPQKIVE